jgi:thioredoxin-related protein
MRYKVRVVPTFVLLNGAGRVVLEQAGAPDQAAVIAAVEQLD